MTELRNVAIIVIIIVTLAASFASQVSTDPVQIERPAIHAVPRAVGPTVVPTANPYATFPAFTPEVPACTPFADKDCWSDLRPTTQ